MPHGGAVEQQNHNAVLFFSFLENINGKSRFACPAVCANGRTGKAGLAGGAGGSSPVSAQSTTKASEITTPIPPKSAPPPETPSRCLFRKISL